MIDAERWDGWGWTNVDNWPWWAACESWYLDKFGLAEWLDAGQRSEGWPDAIAYADAGGEA